MITSAIINRPTQPRAEECANLMRGEGESEQRRVVRGAKHIDDQPACRRHRREVQDSNHEAPADQKPARTSQQLE